MFRTTLLAVALTCVIPVPATAADAPDLTGDWMLTWLSPPGLMPPMGRVEFYTCIVRVEQKDGVPTATLVSSPSNLPAVSVAELKVTGKDVTLAFRGGESLFIKGGTFTGTVGDAGVVRGTITGDMRVFRAQLARTSETTLKASLHLADYPEPMLSAWNLTMRQLTLRSRATNEKDVEKKKALRAELEAFEKERVEKEAHLFREMLDKHADSPFALDAAVLLLKSAGRAQVTLEEAKKLLAVVEKSAAAYGKTYLVETAVDVAESLAWLKEFAGIAADMLRPIVTELPADAAATYQARVLTAYKSALATAGKADEARAVEGRLVKLETKLDAKYLATVPPFTPVAFAGRKDKAATRVAVVELFTGAECKPCIAADVAFDAVAKSYKPTDVVLLQYHLHIPSSDPLTNPATEARASYYGVRGTPSVYFSGTPRAGGGGTMEASEARYGRYVEALAPLLEEANPVKLKGHAKRAGDEVSVTVEGTGLEPGGDARLRLFVVEEAVKYVGGNRMRFHLHVVRAMPDGPDGIAVKEKGFTHTATVNVPALRGDLTKYLDDYAATGLPFRSRLRPLDLKELKVVALVQDDKTKAVLQAVQFDVEDAAGRR
jgi:hypothetical protein